jgi:hypothetical protein
MDKLNLSELSHYVEEHISLFHQRRLDYVNTKVHLKKILEHKNPYLFKAKNILTAYDLIKGFLDAYLQSQEETFFGEFMEGLAVFVCNKVYGAKKSELTGIDLEFEKNNILYLVEIKAGWNWGNSSQIKQLKSNFNNAITCLKSLTDKEIIAVNGCCFGKKKNTKPYKDGYFKICGQEFWELITGEEDFYIRIIEPVGHKAKQKNEEFAEAYSILLNNFTLEFSKQFCMGGKIDWNRLLEFNSGKKKQKKMTGKKKLTTM